MATITVPGLQFPDGTTQNSAGGGVSLSAQNTWTKSQNVQAVTLTDAASVLTDATLGNIFTVTLAGNRTLANPTGMIAGGCYSWLITQDGTGSRTLAYGSDFKWAGGTAPTLSTGAGAVDMISAIWNGTILCAVAQLNFS